MNQSISEEVRRYFKGLAPLTTTSSTTVYESLAGKIPELKPHTLREAVQRISFGSPTSARRNARKFFAIYLEIPELSGATGKSAIYLSLPGIEREYIERMSSGEIELIQSEFCLKYGCARFTPLGKMRV